MELLRTPDDRFANLPGWPYEPKYHQVGNGVRIHYIDEAPASPKGLGDTEDPSDAPVVFCMHGEPTWSYLYRHMVPLFLDQHYRVIAPDLPGFGRSDKPSLASDYSYNGLVEWMVEWFDALSLPPTTDVTLVCQDWGGLIGLRILTARPNMFARAVVANTGLPTGDRAPTDAFLAWQKFSQETPVFPVGELVAGANKAHPLSDEVKAAYDAPFPEEKYKVGARILPSLVPTSPDDPAGAANRAAWEVLAAWTKPFLTAFSDGDPITSGGERIFQRTVPGAGQQQHTTIVGGGHFLQEDSGPEFARVVHEFIQRTR
jgi:haloalkane dehalogenase